MLFEWDESKEKRNIVKHGLDFSTAALIFNDVNRLEWFDERHSEQEDRYITIGEIGGCYGCIHRTARSHPVDIGKKSDK